MAEEQWKSTGYTDVGKALGGVTFTLWFGAFACLLIPAWQTYIWLKFGTWQPITVEYGFLRSGIDPPWSSWAGVQTIITWWLSQSLAGWIALALILAGGLSLWLSIWAYDADHALEQKWRADGWKRAMANRPPDPAD